MNLFNKKKPTTADNASDTSIPKQVSIVEEERAAEPTQSYLLPVYGLLDTLNKHFRNVLGISTTETTYMQRFGYKKTIIFGLMLYVIGALCFYPSATNLSYGGFVGSLFVIACGLATLENCANTYITIIGSRKYASLRINAAQGFNGLASTIAPIVASYAFFGGNEDAGGDLESVKWTYVGVACGVFLIGVLFCFANIPEVDEEKLMAAEAEETGEVVRRASIFSPHLYWVHSPNLCILVLSSEVGHMPDARGSIMLSVGQACFTVGRFLGAILLKMFRPDYLMAVYAVGAIITNVFIIAMKTPETTYALIILLFFESVMFPTIFALGTKDLGRNHKRGSALIIMGVSGGAVLPPIQAVIHDHSNVNISFVIPLVAYVVVLLYGTVGCRWIRYVDEDIAANQGVVFGHEDGRVVDQTNKHKGI
ncbi:major facilitator superfamily domain-containing protein [Mucor lusitanicus]